jgi:hypothetical protein
MAHHQNVMKRSNCHSHGIATVFLSYGKIQKSVIKLQSEMFPAKFLKNLELVCQPVRRVHQNIKAIFL